jgi:hypothetical protein
VINVLRDLVVRSDSERVTGERMFQRLDIPLLYTSTEIRTISLASPYVDHFSSLNVDAPANALTYDQSSEKLVLRIGESHVIT